jgi:DNA-nicking Smr family endonuclease
MWLLLDTAAAMGWKSPFILRKAQENQEKGTWWLSPQVLRMLQEHRRELARKLIPRHCSKCEKALTTKDLIQCSICKRIDYCSITCQENDWPSHRPSCISFIRARDEKLIRHLLLSSSASGFNALALARHDKKELILAADAMIARGAYADAIRCLTLAIEKQIATKKSLSQTTKFKDQAELASLVGKRATCYLKIAERNSSLRQAVQADHECSFVLPDGIFSRYLIKDSHPIYKSLMQTQNMARELREKLQDSVTSKLPLRELFAANRGAGSEEDDQEIGINNLEALQQRIEQDFQEPSAASASASATQTSTSGLSRSQRRRRNKKKRLLQLADLSLRQHAASASARARMELMESVVDVEPVEDDDDEAQEENETTRLDKPKVVLCKKLATFKTKAINAQNKDDYCSICMQQWGKFEEPTIAVILECRHATCVSCLFQFRNKCLCDDDGPDFYCPLCKCKLDSGNTLEFIAAQVVRQKLIPSFSSLTSYLPMSKPETDKLLVSLLLNEKFQFDVMKVENALFNMLTLVQFDDTDEFRDLNPDQKQEIYVSARKPVQLLHERYMSLRTDLGSMLNTEDERFKAKHRELVELKRTIQEATRNAMHDIFDRVNSRGNKGCVFDSENDTCKIDLHGLHVEDAKTVLDEYVLPCLPVLERIMIVTGCGVQEKLRKSLLAHLESLRYEHEPVMGNKGAFYLLKK